MRRSMLGKERTTNCLTGSQAHERCTEMHERCTKINERCTKINERCTETNIY